MSYFDNIEFDQNTLLKESIVDDVKNSIINTKDLWDQWRKAASSFVKHKWIYRYITEEQKEQLEKHYANLCNEDTNYSTYKRSFNFICKFMGLPNDRVIIENMAFAKDKEDKDQWELALKYSKGLIKVKIPEGIRLIHVSPVAGISELIPAFRSKTKGKYMYPNKRVFFTVARDIKAKQAGLEGKKTSRYTPKEKFTTAYIDPTYSDFSSGAIYIETERPIPVESYEKKLDSLFKKNSGGDN